ncbi:hypothetical protein KC19_6G034500 [Ceratodon purpureus]|uniref:Protein kinase domain-containing protein n=1 Tax=Ceratodon purpureus TaxID=3225 RepID=A0A8T0H9Y2_CERPU|nr:hypothetical protein KC19_6G034500 [Ceratodon purpureus]
MTALSSGMALQIWFRNIFTFVLWLCLQIQIAIAQEDYNNVTGYACTGARSTCQSYTVYRTEGSQNLSTIASNFNTSATEIANASGVDPTLVTLRPFGDHTLLYVPLACSCFNGTYQSRIWYAVMPLDTMLIIANSTFQGLTTYPAIQAANPTVVPTNMSIGQLLNIPLQCSCPSTEQLRVGSQLLVTYSIFPQDTIVDISKRFNVSESDIEDANGVTDQMAQKLVPFSILLIPLPALVPLNSSNFALPPQADPPLTPAQVPSLSGPAMASSKDPSEIPLDIAVAVGAVAGALAAILACVLCTTVRHYKRIIDGYKDADRRSFMKASVASSSYTTGNDFNLEITDILGSDNPLRFSYEELLTATNHFSDENRIHGSVFLGKLKGSLVAIKQMKGNMSDELKILSQVHHGNVVRLVGVCATRSENLYLVFEYAENGSLSDCLHYQIAYPSSSFSRSVGLLSWKLRIQIALDIALGLEYLHSYTQPSLVHKDVKSSNILLDRQFRAKVANFGMAKIAEPGQGGIMTEHIVGTQGYLAPEYLEQGLITTRVDVFSFGVVLLEMLSGQEAISSNGEAGQFTHLSTTIFDVLSDVLSSDEQMAKLQAWMDSRLLDAYPPDIAYSVASLARTCVETDPSKRPDMKEISFALSKMYQASLQWESSTRYTATAVDAR